MLDELNQGLSDLKKANLPEYAKRLRLMELKLKDLEYRLKPLLEIIKPKG